MMESKSIDTQVLFRLLHDNDEFGQFLECAGNAVNDPELTFLLAELLNTSKISISQIADAAMLSQSYAYQIFSGVRSPGRNTLICISLTFRSDLETTQRLLTVAKKGELYPRVRRDAAIIYAIEHEFSLSHTEEFLIKLGEVSLLSRSLQDYKLCM